MAKVEHTFFVTDDHFMRDARGRDVTDEAILAEASQRGKIKVVIIDTAEMLERICQVLKVKISFSITD